MKVFCRLTLLASLVATVTIGKFDESVAWALIVDVRDSSAFVAPVAQIEGNVIPSPALGASTGWSSDGNVLSMDMTPSGDNLIGHNGILDPSLGFTGELRFRIAQPYTLGDHSAVLHIVPGANRWFLIDLKPTELRNEVNGALLFSGDLSADFHTVRLAVPGNAGPGHLYVDGVEVSDNLATTAFGNLNRFWFGDDSGNIVNGIVDVDYFRVDTTGAYAPVPEPGSFILAIGGIVALAVWRCRAG